MRGVGGADRAEALAGVDVTTPPQCACSMAALACSVAAVLEDSATVAPGREGFMRRLRVLGSTGLVVVLVGLGLTACLPASAGKPGIRVTPALFPAFDRSVTDYVNRCDPSKSSGVQVTAIPGDTVSVNGSRPRSGSFNVNVSQQIGQSFTIAVTSGGVTTTHFVRCLPADFPESSVEKPGAPQAAFYLTSLLLGYTAIFDPNGVPIWWLKGALIVSVLPNKNLAAISRDGMTEYDLNGAPVRKVAVVGNRNPHDVIMLPNGNYVLGTADLQPCDLSSWDATFTEPRTCINHVFEEFTPAGLLVGSWDTSSHIPVSETTQPWRDEQLSATRDFYDPWHWNSVEFTGDGFLLSFRHLDAIYKISSLSSTGSVVWKLGGTTRPESLTLVNDPLNGVSGQHDARWDADGTVTIFDNGTNGLGPSRQPRAVRYAVNTSARTATLVADVRDSRITSSSCCGSTRVLPGGNWVNGWGGTTTATENLADGTRVFGLTVAGQTGRIYRAIPLLPGQFTAAELRTGMDAQYSGFGALATTSRNSPESDMALSCDLGVLFDDPTQTC